MNNLNFKRIISGFCFLLSCATLVNAADISRKNLIISKLAFGSCYQSGKNPQIWKQIEQFGPQLTLLMGDNVYADSEKAEEIEAAYRELTHEENFINLRKKCEIFATWDDHDYGKDDAGAEFPAKKESKEAYMRAFQVSESHPMRQREGIYHSVMCGEKPRRVQLIFLDTRWFRSPLKVEGHGPFRRCVANEDEGATILGEQQWNWLQQELKEEAELRILVSSIQVIPMQHRFEKWANFPREREKLLKILKDPNLGKVCLLTGDRHMGEVSQEGTLLEVTSSGLTRAGGGAENEKNRFRLGSRIGKRQFGTLKIQWLESGPQLALALRGKDGEVLLAHP